MAANKLDYSRLLDDEFLNRTPERGRGCAVSRGAAEVLGLQGNLPADDGWSGPSRVTVFLYGAAMAAAVLISIIFALLLVHAHQEGVQRLQTLGMPFAQRLTMDNESLLDTENELPIDADEESILDTSPSPTGDAHDYAEDYNYDDDPHEHDHGEDHDHNVHGAADETEHHIALAGGFEDADEDHDHPQGLHEHVNPGDVVMEDHHIVPAGDPEPPEYVLLLCLPIKGAAQANATNITESTLHLSRAQRDVVHSVVEYVSEAAQCHLIVLQGVGEEAQVNATTQAPVNGTAPKIIGFNTGCGAPEDADDELVGAEADGHFVLTTGRTLPVIRWDAASLFANSPLTSVWRNLRTRRAAGASSSPTSAAASAAGPDLLGVSARVQLLWRYAGLSVDLGASSDKALKALSVFNRSDTTHVYLETTRAVLLAAPQTCNAVVFDLIKAISSDAADGTTQAQAEHYDVADVKVFDDVLNAYCRGNRRHARSVNDTDVRAKNKIVNIPLRSVAVFDLHRRDDSVHDGRRRAGDRRWAPPAEPAVQELELEAQPLLVPAQRAAPQ
ncbi:hypothetical protein FOCC_FOCC002855, partial [Frankliniella occidentalis]